MKGLAGKRFVIAGGASGIGAATGKRLASEGALVVLGDINEGALASTVDEIRADGGNVYGIKFDMNEPSSIELLIEQCDHRYGGLDGLVNVAANLSPESMTADVDVLHMDPSFWDRVLRTNLIGYSLAIKSALPYLIASGGGSIVNVSSAAAWLGLPDYPAYASSKSAGHSLTRHVARRWGKENIRCNSVAPGQIITEAARELFSEEELEKKIELIACSRLGTPEDVASAAVFLLSDESQWITGQVISVDGGWTFRE